MGKDIDKKGDKTVAKNKEASTILVEAFFTLMSHNRPP